MNYVLAVIAILIGSFFGLHHETDSLMRATSLGIGTIALLYIIYRGKRALNERRGKKVSGWDSPNKSPLSKHVDER